MILSPAPSSPSKAIDSLRRAILLGELAPGTHLGEVALATDLGVSRGTVREAIRSLTAEGLVKHRLYKGAEVRRLEPEDIEDCHRLRELIETSAVLQEPTRAQLARINEGMRQFGKAARAGSWAKIVEADFELHRRLVELHRSPRILDAYGRNQAEIRLFIAFITLRHEEYRNPAAVLAEHRHIVQLVRQGRRAEAADAVRAHIAVSQEKMLDMSVRASDLSAQQVSEVGHSPQSAGPDASVWAVPDRRE